MQFYSIEEMIAAAAAGVRPPERLTVAEAAEKYRYLSNVGSYVGFWDNDVAPYLVEPMEVLTSTDYTGMIFAGPARTGKSDMFFNWLAHTAVCDPADMMMVHMTMNVARDWSAKDLKRVFRHSPLVGATLAKYATHDVSFLSGMHLLVKWPAITELSGKTVGRNWIADYDRIPESIDGEGNAYDLTAKRATTFRRYGMTVAESSPGFPIELPEGVKHWAPLTPHEAPPSKGILSLYNRGDRRRWFWKCPHCATPFEPDFKLLTWPSSTDHVEAAEQAALRCPHCASLMFHEGRDGMPGKHELNIGGRWVRDGMIWTREGTIEGKPYRSDIASFWMKGPAATFTSWRDLVLKYLKAEEEFERTGSQEALKTTVNTDQGLPYQTRGAGEERLPEDVKALAKDIGEKVVPEGVRFLTMTVDVQKKRFELQTHGHRPCGTIVVIDRFALRRSERIDEDDLPMPVEPAVYPEDWDLLIEHALTKTYPLADESGRHMAIKMVGVDSGGAAGRKKDTTGIDADSSVTKNAYAFYRRLKASDGTEFPANLHRRLLLLKGSSNANAPRVQISYPDSERKDRHALARGEIPVLMLNGNALKDSLNAMLDRKTGGHTVEFADWLPDWYWNEMVAETKTEKGWENPKKLRNEAWDLLSYSIAICLYRPILIERLDWDNPPAWADEWEVNALVSDPEFNKQLDSQPAAAYDLASLASTLA